MAFQGPTRLRDDAAPRARPGRAEPAGVSARQRYSGWKKPARLLAKLRRTPEGRVGEAEQTARLALVLALGGALKPVVAQIKHLDQRIATAIREHPDGEIFLSLFKDSVVDVDRRDVLRHFRSVRMRS
jgi:hypothetical protein